MGEGKQKIVVKNEGIGGGIYFFAFLGAAIYYIENAASFGDGLWGVIKALFWPAMLLYKAFEALGL